MAGFAPSHFVDFIDKDDAHLLGALHGHTCDLVHVQQLVFFFLNQVFESVGHTHLSFLLLLPEHAGEHVLELADVHLIDALVGDDFERGHGALADFEIHYALVQLAFAELNAKLFACALRLFALRGNLAFRGAGRRRRWRRTRLRRATATARLAAFCPTMYLSSSTTISRGVMSSSAGRSSCPSTGSAPFPPGA